MRRGGRDDRPLSPGTVHRVHVVLHRALTQAVRWEWIWLNPAALASPPRVEPADIRPPSVEQIRRLLDVVRAEDIDFFTYLHLAVRTGARRTQLLALRWSDVDFTRAALGFCRALVDGPTGPVLRPTKNRRTYRVALDTTSVELLVAHRDRATRTDGVVDGFVFSRDAGRHAWRPNWVTKRSIAYRRRAGLAAFRLHDLRHFMATTMLAAGVPVPVVSERLCHARTSTTVNIYAHAMPGGDRAAVNLLRKLLTPAPVRAAGLLAKTGRARSVQGPGLCSVPLALSSVVDRPVEDDSRRSVRAFGDVEGVVGRRENRRYALPELCVSTDRPHADAIFGRAGRVAGSPCTAGPPVSGKMIADLLLAGPSPPSRATVGRIAKEE